jgi:GNAT superfamily N-acetyltransferase
MTVISKAPSEDRVRLLKALGRRVQLQVSAGGLEWLRREAACLTHSGVDASERFDSATRRCAQLTLAALSRLGWRPVVDAATREYPAPPGAVRVEGCVVTRVRCAWLQELAVCKGAPERQGLGSAAFRAFEAWAQEEGAEVIRLLAPKPTVGFWLRHGFVVASVDAGGSMRMVRVLGEIKGASNTKCG